MNQNPHPTLDESDDEQATLDLWKACFQGETKDIKKALDRGANPNTLLFDNKTTPIMTAIQCNETKCVEMLLHLCDFDMKNVAGLTPLDLARAADAETCSVVEKMLISRDTPEPAAPRKRGMRM